MPCHRVAATLAAPRNPVHPKLLPFRFRELPALLSGRDGGGLKGQLTRGAAGSFVLKIMSALIGLLITALFARLLGPDGLGRYAFAWSVIVLLSVPACLGSPNIAVRFTASYLAREQWPLLRGFVTTFRVAMLIASLLVLVVAAAVLMLRADSIEPSSLSVMLVALLLLPVRPQQIFAEGATRGLGRIVGAQAPEAVGRHVTIVILLGIAWLLGIVPDRLTPAGLMTMQVISSMVMLGLISVLLHRAMPRQVSGAEPERDTAEWVRSGLPLVAVTVLSNLNGQFNLLATGWLGSAEDTGIFRVSLQSVMMVNFFLMAANMALAPAIASLHARDERGRLQRVLTGSARTVLLAALPVALFLMVFSGWFLGLVFGAEFARGGTALAIMAFGQLVNAAAGSVGVVLNMTGNERYSVYGLGTALVANVILCWLLIPGLGVTGAAIAYTVSIVTWNTMLYALVVRRTGFHTAAWYVRPPGQ